MATPGQQPSSRSSPSRWGMQGASLTTSAFTGQCCCSTSQPLGGYSQGRGHPISLVENLYVDLHELRRQWL